MVFEDTFEKTKQSLQGSLDDIVSPRTASSVKLQALKNIERTIALAYCAGDAGRETRDSFLALQYTFECNIPSRILAYITLATIKLDSLTARGVTDEQAPEINELAQQLLLSLSILQGVALSHPASKVFMGRKCSLEILLDLFLVSRYLPAPLASSASTASTTENLSSVTLDTILCILVDSSPALRAFEGANGVQAVVKILKRAGTPREVRMKCLEFLYFYLLDEAPNSSGSALLAVAAPRIASPPTVPTTPTTPSTPAKSRKPYFAATPLRTPSRPTSSTISISSGSASSRSTSGSSFRSNSSGTSASTANTSVMDSPQKPSTASVSPAPAVTKSFLQSPIKRLGTPRLSPPRSPADTTGPSNPPQARSMMMLKKEVDYTPQSPKKPTYTPRHPHSKSQSMSNVWPSSSSTSSTFSSRSLARISTESGAKTSEALLGRATASGSKAREQRVGNWKTTEEKKEMLGTMLGNVDALVEGVRKAGIWGLA